jgi:hypothetical protein
MSRFKALFAASALVICSGGCAGCDEASAKPSAVAAPVGTMSDASAKSDGGWRAVSSDALCATSGALLPKGEGRFAIDAPTFRAVSSSASGRAELAFVYEGATTTSRALGSGAIRRQLGLKLEARNPCNLVYAMWRLRDNGEGELVVQWKHNADQTTSAQCGNRGYETIRPRKATALPNVAVGARHVLRAEIEGESLRVLVDGVSSWEGSLPREALDAKGVIGLRSDNVRFEGELRISGGEAVPCAAEGTARASRGGGDDNE